MDPYFAWIEQTGLSVWVRESPSLLAFPTILIFHALGMGFLAGTSSAVSLRILGAAPKVPLAVMQSFFPVMWAAFWVNAVSGVALLAAYPVKALTNPLFYVKLALIGVAVFTTRKLANEVVRAPEVDAEPLPANGRKLAIATLACWVAAIAAGRMLAYTYSRLMTTD